MSERKIYSKAPITEAVLEIRVKPQAETSEAVLRDVHSQIKDRYPNSSEIALNEVRIEFGPKPSSSTIVHKGGLRLSGTDPADVVQLQFGLMAVSRLSPYKRWEILEEKARYVWERYSQVVHPVAILRIGVRYINRFDFPGSSLELKDYLNVHPSAPGGKLFENISGSLMQLQSPQVDISALLVINEAYIPPVVPNTTAFVVDIDLFSTGNWQIDDSSVWRKLQDLHVRKNEVFEAVMTDKSRSLIE